MDLLTTFTTQRPQLEAVAYRMLGDAAEAQDVVQETWLKAQRAGDAGIANPAGWLRTIASRLCLDRLRARREEPLAGPVERPAPDPEQEALLADAVGPAMLVVLDRLAPAERVAFVLHDLFEVPFEAIAPILGRNATATRQLASRARRRVRGAPHTPDLARQRAAVEAFMAASRAGDFDGLMAILDPQVHLRADRLALPPGMAATAQGAETVVRRALAFSGRAGHAFLAYFDGQPGVAVAPGGKLQVVMLFGVRHGRIKRMEVVADPRRLARLAVALPRAPSPGSCPSPCCSATRSCPGTSGRSR